MWTRGVIGVVLCLVGLVWIGQGTNALSNSKLMSGHGQYTALGVVVLVVGLVFLAWAVRVRRRTVGDHTGLEVDGGPEGYAGSDGSSVGSPRSCSSHPDA